MNSKSNTKRFSLGMKIIAAILMLAFVFQSMSQINSHAYSTGIDSYHYTCGCFGCWQTHLAVKCSSENSLCIPY